MNDKHLVIYSTSFYIICTLLWKTLNFISCLAPEKIQKISMKVNALLLVLTIAYTDCTPHMQVKFRLRDLTVVENIKPHGEIAYLTSDVVVSVKVTSLNLILAFVSHGVCSLI